MAQGYGTDIWCVNGLQTGRFARGRALVAQALYRRLITPRGTLRGGPEEENYGIDLAGYCGQIGYANAIAAIPAVVRGELSKDDRVSEVSCEAASSTDSTGMISLVLTITVRLVDEDETFDLTIGVSDVTVSLLGIAA